MCQNCYLVGIDVDKSALLSCKQNYDDVVLASATHLPFRDKSFDHSACIDVIDLPEVRAHRSSIIREIERVTRISIFYHFFNGKIGPMKEVLSRYGKVRYIGGRNCEIIILDGYKKRYRYQREWFEDLININDEEIRELLRILLSHYPTFKTEKIYLGSYLMEVDLQNTAQREFINY
jgi:ubiquinone/menaquinone biosynthesis C-methylase UbiE